MSSGEGDRRERGEEDEVPETLIGVPQPKARPEPSPAGDDDVAPTLIGVPQTRSGEGGGSDHRTPETAAPTGADAPFARGPVSPAESIGDQVGPYRLISKLGEGGFGEVWLAERRTPFVQRVALKVIKLGMDSRAVMARFEQERQALAVMNHPHVASVIDGGMTAAGRSYLAMEYVPGERITAFCDSRRLSIRQRLELFGQVCDAVQHAHMKGIIHRDLKPTNILVSEIEEGRYSAKVIDFGVAKALSGPMNEDVHTETGQMVGTIEYMSPEQADPGEQDIDTRSDIYSLGVVLYELLIGMLPFDGKELRRGGYREIQRIIREVDPPTPSARLTTISGHDATAARAIAEGRREHLATLAGTLRRELEWIPLKAMRKERQERYATAQDLGADVRNYLEGRALVAAPESRSYRIRKYVRRNKAIVTGVSAVAAALVFGLGLATWQWQVATANAAEADRQRLVAVEARDLAEEQRNAATLAREEAERQRSIADEQRGVAEDAARAERQRAEELRQLSDLQAEMLAQVDPVAAGVELRRDVVDRFSESIARGGLTEAERAAVLDDFDAKWSRVNTTDAALALIDRAVLQPAVASIEAELAGQPLVDAQLRQTVADRYRRLGLFDAAMPLQEAALGIRQRELGDAAAETIASLNAMAILLRSQGRFAESELRQREALRRCRENLPEADPLSLEVASNMGSLLQARGRFAEAEPYLAEAITRYGRSLGPQAPETLEAVSRMAELRQAQGRYEEAEDLFRQVLATRREILGEEHPDTLVSINRLGGLLLDQGNYDEAGRYYLEALEKARRTLGELHPETLRSLDNLGTLRRAQRRYAEADAFFRDAIEKRRRILGEDHPDTLLSINNLGFLRLDEGRFGDAESAFRDALERRRPILGENHPDTLASINNMGVLRLSQGRLEEAEPFLADALERRRRILGEEHPDTLASISNMGGLQFRLGNLPQAEAFIGETLAIRRRTLGDEHPSTLNSITSLGSLLFAQGKLAEAEPLFAEAVDLHQRIFGERSPATVLAVLNLGSLLSQLDRPAEVVAVLGPAKAAAIEDREKSPGTATVLLVTLARARMAMGFEAARFAAVESELLEAFAVAEAAGDSLGQWRLEAMASLADLYEAWHANEPAAGHDAKSMEWDARLNAAVDAEG